MDFGGKSGRKVFSTVANTSVVESATSSKACDVVHLVMPAVTDKHRQFHLFSFKL
jgi:hypothetical protein